MSNPFLGRDAIIDGIKSKERTNAKQKRGGLTDHPVRFTICGCPDPNCAGWHTIETDRNIPSPEECKNILKADNMARKVKQPRSKSTPLSPPNDAKSVVAAGRLRRPLNFE